ncbi:MAG: amidohydrolase family protein [Acidimicrobiales bacterium]|nr:amidohydrolase family protein [Acidimicrobiales bacterium]
MTASLVLRGGQVLVDDFIDGRWDERDLWIRCGTIVDGDAPADTPELDVEGCFVAPGLLDLQCNGAVAIDLRSEPDRLWEVSAALPRFGVTAWLPTIVTSTPETIEAAQAALHDGPPDGWRGAWPIGLHLEGPFLSPDAAGAHPVDLLRPPNLDAIADWAPETGIVMVTMAPELPGAGPVIEELADRGVCVSVGHSQATDDQVHAAVRSGVRSVTHLFNAMSPLHHRAPGVVGAAMSDPRLRVGLIADGVHVDASVVSIAHRAVGNRLYLVSDAVATLGTLRTETTVGVRRQDGTLAGSALGLLEAVNNLVAFATCPRNRALAAAAKVPAALLGDHTRGRLATGTRGDVLVLSAGDEDGLDLDLEYTVIAGEIVHPTPWPDRPP